MKTATLKLVAILALLAPRIHASTVTMADPQSGGIGYRYTVAMGGLDAATFSNHVGAWSWEDNGLFNEANGEAPVGWTHTSNWVALTVSVRSVFKVRVERDAAVPWPSQQEPNRLASTASMYPSFTLWKSWDNDLAPQAFADANNSGVPTDDWHTYNNRGAVAWAEDLIYQNHFANSTLEVVEREYVLEPGQYTIVIGSNAPANDINRQGYKATFTTTQEFPIVIGADSYFTESSAEPLIVPAEKGIIVNDTGVTTPVDVIALTEEPDHGTVQVNPDGSFTFTPGQYFGVQGYDTFKYHLLVGGDSATPTPEGTVVISTIAAAAGTHAGLIRQEDTLHTTGLVKIDLAPTGVWTGAVEHLGRRYAFTGRLDVDGKLVPRGREARLPLPIEFQLSIEEDGNRYVHAKIHAGADQFNARASKSPFSILSPPPSLGWHTVSLEVANATAGALQKPGTGLLRIKLNGLVVFSGVLGDGTPFLCGSALVDSGGPGPTLPVYAGVYARPGNVAGELTFGAAATSDASGTLTAFKPGGAKPTRPGFTITYEAETTRR